MPDIDVPDQPPGIDDDDPADVPTPADAATRVLRYIEASGDGLYDVVDDRGARVPLYARDLYAVARAIRDGVVAG
jgi:hypothetical protein